MRKNEKILFRENRINRFKSVVSPSAPSAGLCASGNDDFVAEYAVNFANFFENNKNEPLKFITGLLYCYGLRISEVLALTSECVIGENQLFIKGSKGSENRIIQVIYAPQCINSLLMSNVPLSAVFSRFYVYRELKKYGLYAYFDGNSNASATHLSRHLKVLELKKNKVPRETISKFIGHKSIKSLIYYEKAIRKKSNS
jgi:integrase